MIHTSVGLVGLVPADADVVEVVATVVRVVVEAFSVVVGCDVDGFFVT
jgi:hypothetical protein